MKRRNILLVLFVTILLLSQLYRLSHTWIFIDSAGREYTGRAAINGWDAPVKPWSEVVEGKTGVLRLYRANGKIFIERTYKEGRLHGHYRVWHRNGQIDQDAEYADGEEHGKLQMWYPDGTQRVMAYREMGRQHGLYQEWYPDGSPRSIINYNRGVLDGPSKSWDVRGNLVEDGVWKENYQYEGRLIVHQRVGQPPVVGIYKNGDLVEIVDGTPALDNGQSEK